MPTIYVLHPDQYPPLVEWLRKQIEETDDSARQQGHAALLALFEPYLRERSKAGLVAQRAVLLLAACYQEHDGYREDWRP